MHGQILCRLYDSYFLKINDDDDDHDDDDDDDDDDDADDDDDDVVTLLLLLLLLLMMMMMMMMMMMIHSFQMINYYMTVLYYTLQVLSQNHIVFIYHCKLALKSPLGRLILANCQKLANLYLS